MEEYREAFVGIDDAKLRNAVAVADGERGGEVRYLGEFDASDASMIRLVKRLAAKYDRVHFCYEAGPTGYGLHRLITGLGYLKAQIESRLGRMADAASSAGRAAANGSALSARELEGVHALLR